MQDRFRSTEQQENHLEDNASSPPDLLQDAPWVGTYDVSQDASGWRLSREDGNNLYIRSSTRKDPPTPRFVASSSGFLSSLWPKGARREFEVDRIRYSMAGDADTVTVTALRMSTKRGVK